MQAVELPGGHLLRQLLLPRPDSGEVQPLQRRRSPPPVIFGPTTHVINIVLQMGAVVGGGVEGGEVAGEGGDAS